MSVTGNSNGPLNGLTPTNQGGNAYNPANNRLLEAGYDAAGNMSTVGALSFWYDAEGRQTQSYDSGSHYSYDADGQRVQKTASGGATTVYIHDAFGQLAAEYASSAPAPPCTTCYLSYDHLGSVRLITDQNANVVSRHDYLPFGEEIPNGSGGRSGNGFGAPSSVNQMFTGQERDGETVPNLDFFNARYFMGVLGSFTSPDPGNAGADLYNPQSWNAYAYVLGNPLNGVDPSGLCSSSDNPPCYSASATTAASGDPDFATSQDPYLINNWISFLNYSLMRLSGGGGGGGGAVGGRSAAQRSTPVGAPKNNPTRVPHACAAITALKGLANLGIGITKGILGAGSLATTPATGPIGAVGAAYGFIGAAGQGTAGVVQILGALSGNANTANSAANVLTTVTTVFGSTTLIATRGNLGAASKAAGLESIGMAGVNGGLTGHLIDQSANWIQKLLLGADLAQTNADAADIPTGCVP